MLCQPSQLSSTFCNWTAPAFEVILKIVWCFSGAEDCKHWIVYTSKLSQNDLV